VPSFIFNMSVKPVLLKDLRRTAVHNHCLNVGKDDYNRFSPLSVVLDAAKLGCRDAEKKDLANNSYSQVAKKVPAKSAEISSEEALTKKVKATLRDAEKKSLIFNLNLGTSQMMNKDSISRKVTTTIGQIVHAGKHDYVIDDAEDVIDDHRCQ
jgi:hypothetical protein